jgi:hypothetical protein
MRNGMAEQIYVIEINRQPVFFSWTDEPHQYSFYVPTGRKSEISLRLYDRVLILDSLSFAEGMKTILSIDIDHLPPGVRVHKIDLPKPKNKYERVYPSFTHVELNRYISFLSSFKRVDGNAYVEANHKFTPLFSSQFYSPKESIIVGPLMPGKQTFIGTRDNIHTTYQHTGGYNYGFEDNIVYKSNADKLIPERLFPAPFQPMTTVNVRDDKKGFPGKCCARLQVAYPIDRFG